MLGLNKKAERDYDNSNDHTIIQQQLSPMGSEGEIESQLPMMNNVVTNYHKWSSPSKHYEGTFNNRYKQGSLILNKSVVTEVNDFKSNLMSQLNPFNKHGDISRNNGHIILSINIYPTP